MKKNVMIAILILFLSHLIACGSGQGETRTAERIQTGAELEISPGRETEPGSAAGIDATNTPPSEPGELPAATKVPPSSTATQSPQASTPSQISPFAFNPVNESSLDQLLFLKNNQVGRIRLIAWSPDGQRLAIAGSLGMVMLDVSGMPEKSPEELWSLLGLRPVDRMEYSADGSLLLYTDGTGFAQLYSVEDGTLKQEFIHAGNASAMNPDLTRIAIREEGWVGVRDLISGENLQQFRADVTTGDIWVLAFSGDGKRVMGAAMDGDVLVWDVATGTRTRTFDTGFEKMYECVQGNAQSGGWLVQYCHYPTENYTIDNVDVWVWNTNNDRQQFLYTINDRSAKKYYRIAVSQEDRILAANVEGGIEIWDTSAGMRLTKSWALDDVEGLAFRPAVGGTTLATWDPGGVQFWDTSTGELVSEYNVPGSSAPVRDLAFSAGSTGAIGSLPGRLLAVGRMDGIVELWDLGTGEKLLDLDQMPADIAGLAFDQGGLRLVVGSEDGTVRVWDMSGENPVLQEEMFAAIQLTSLAFSPDGATIVLGGSTTRGGSAALEIWDPLSGTRRASLSTGMKGILSLALNQDGTRLAVGGSEPRFQVWDYPKANKIAEVDLNSRAGAEAVEFSPDGRMLVVVTGKDFYVWDTVEQSTITRLRGQEYVERTAFNPDQCTLVISAARYLDFMEVESAKNYLSLYDSDPTVVTQALAFSPDGYLLAFGSNNGTVGIWGVGGALSETGQASVLCGMVPPPPTATPSPFPSATPLATATPLVTDTPEPKIPPLTRSLYLQSPPMQGDDVLELQFRLSSLGYSEVGIPDGIFGRLTDEAVRHFQELNGLTVDGVVGPLTWEKLFSSNAVRAD